MEEVTDEPLYRDRVCGIDIGKAGMAATIRVPSDANPARRAQETRSFGTTKREVLALADWLRSWQVPAVVMEATGDYWKPVFYRLEAEGFECVLADAKQVKHLPGRPKRDPSDSRWLAACFERGAITSCFVAIPEFRIMSLSNFLCKPGQSLSFCYITVDSFRCPGQTGTRSGNVTANAFMAAFQPRVPVPRCPLSRTSPSPSMWRPVTFLIPR